MGKPNSKPAITLLWIYTTKTFVIVCRAPCKKGMLHQYLIILKIRNNVKINKGWIKEVMSQLYKSTMHLLFSNEITRGMLAGKDLLTYSSMKRMLKNSMWSIGHTFYYSMYMNTYMNVHKNMHKMIHAKLWTYWGISDGEARNVLLHISIFTSIRIYYFDQKNAFLKQEIRQSVSFSHNAQLPFPASKNVLFKDMVSVSKTISNTQSHKLLLFRIKLGGGGNAGKKWKIVTFF